MSFALKDRSKKQYKHRPYKRKRVTTGVNDWRKKLFGLCGGILVVLVIYYTFYSPYIRIVYVEVSDTSFIPREEIKQTILTLLDEGRVFPVDTNNYFILRSSHIKRILSEKYVLKNIKVRKVWPDTLRVTFEEDIQLLTHATINNDMWSIVNREGKIAKLILPYEYDPTIPIFWSSTEDVSKNTVDLLYALTEIQKRYSDLFELQLLRVENDVIHVSTNKSFSIEIPHDMLKEILITRLDALVNEFNKTKTLPKEYILFQTDEKAFYR